ncbi:MAG: sigma 54-interacting transcriptional regulator [Planctomycetota bacterium]|jgi:transcriptional regulator with PAS, ATPase and Fis domain
MFRNCIVVTDDSDLRSRISLIADGRPDVSITFQCDPALAIKSLKDEPLPTVLVDARPEWFSSRVDQFVSQLAGAELPAVDVASISGSLLPAAIAAELDLLEVARFDESSLHFAEELRGWLDSLASRPNVRPVPESRSVRANEVAITTFTPEFFPVVDDIIRVASREVTILLVGETGTGKTTLARFVHELSPRKHRQFQNLACGALPNDLIESELFGHTRGAFTGADRNKIGRFEAAGHGTLLLDEIDVLDLKQQTKLLKVIETGEYEMVGSTEPRKSEARLIVASNVNLQSLAEAGDFRSDLYYRLNVLEFRLPPLRNRTLDLPFLIMEFVRELTVEHNIQVDHVHRDFLDALRQYDWPGNLRELKNHVRRAVLFCEDGRLTVNDLSHKVINAQFQNGDRNGRQKDDCWTLADRVADTERTMLLEALRANGNNRTKTARALGISRVGLYKKMRRLGMLEETARSV